MVDIDVRVLSHLKEELTWAIYKWLWVISNLKNSESTKELKELKNKALNNIVCIAMWPLVTYVF